MKVCSSCSEQKTKVTINGRIWEDGGNTSTAIEKSTGGNKATVGTSSNVTTYDALYAVSGVDANGDIVLKVVNVSDRAQNIKVSLNGAGNIGSEGLATVLTAESPMHENSYKQPKKVAPVKKKVSGLGKAFIYSFDKNSVTILRIKTEK